jgi:hypothetical protein
VVCDPHSGYQEYLHLPGYNTQQSYIYFTSVSEQYLPEDGDKLTFEKLTKISKIIRSHIPSQSAAAAAVLICIYKISVSNLGLDTDYRNWSPLWL